MIRTLVVDDDFRVARMHIDYLGKLDGFEPVGAALNARSALDQVRQLRPDLVLLDVYLPDQSGVEVAKTIRALSEPQPDLFFVTAARDVEILKGAIRGGALHYLVKPFTFRVFREKLQQYQQWREHLACAVQADQTTVDRLLRTLRPEPPETPKGVAAPTLDVVLAALRQLGRPASTLDVAAASGVSRATARRYLDHLCHIGVVRREMEYGTTGRPKHRFVPVTVEDERHRA